MDINFKKFNIRLWYSARYFSLFGLWLWPNGKKWLQKEWFPVESSTFCFGIWPKTKYFSLFYLRLWPNVKMQLRSFTEWRAHCAKIEPFSKIFWVPQKKKNKKMPSKGVICNRKSPLTPPQAKLLKYIFWPYV